MPERQLYEEDYFTKTAYPGGYRDFSQHNTRFDTLMHLAKPKSLLDVGCAYGYMVGRALARGIHAVGMDISVWCAKQANVTLPEGHFIRQDVEQGIPFKDKEFDCLYCEGVLEHIAEDKIDFVLSEMARVANKRVLAISFEGDARGHICLHDSEWWKQRIPSKTWLYMGNCSSDVDPFNWYYKGENENTDL